MAEPENLIARLIPGDLENQIPAAVKKVLPGGFKNRMIQAGLALLIAFGLSFVVKRLIDLREARTRPAIPPAPAAAAALPRPAARPAQLPAEPEAPAAVGLPAMAELLDSSAPIDPAQVHRYPLLASPHVHLSGTVDQVMYASFREQIAAAPQQGALVIALSTLGGDPEVARLMGDEVRLMREFSGRELLFLGKVAVYSAGATFMSAFPVDKRFLTRGTRIMVHERIMTSEIHLSGPLKTLTATLKAKLHEIEHSVKIEEEGFRDLVAGSRISFDELCRRAPANWYIEAEEARELGLILDVI